MIDIASAQRIIEESGLGSPETVLIGIARSLVNRPFNAPDRAVAVLSNDERDFLLAGGAQSCSPMPLNCSRYQSLASPK